MALRYIISLLLLKNFRLSNYFYIYIKISRRETSKRHDQTKNKKNWTGLDWTQQVKRSWVLSKALPMNNSTNNKLVLEFLNTKSWSFLLTNLKKLEVNYYFSCLARSQLLRLQIQSHDGNPSLIQIKKNTWVRHYIQKLGE